MTIKCHSPHECYQTLVIRMSLNIHCLFAVTHDSMNQEFQICGQTPYSSEKVKLFLYLIKQHAMKMYKTADIQVSK